MEERGRFKRAFSFYAGKPCCTGDRDYALAGACFPILAPLVYGMCNAAAAAGLFVLYGASKSALLASAGSLILYYLLKGIRLIDGYTDCIEGVTLAVSRKTSRDEVRAAMQSSANGAFGIVWVGLLLITQFSLMHALLALPVLEAACLFAMCAAVSGHCLISAHIGRPAYHPSSQFASFGGKLGLRSFFLSSLVCAGFSFLPAISALSAVALLACSTALGLALRLLLQKTVVHYNGDVVGFILLVSETLTLLTILCKGGFI